MFRGTGGICQLVRNEDYPDIFTSAVCRSSGGAWNGGHDLVLSSSDIGIDEAERSHIYSYSWIIISVVGNITILFKRQIFLNNSRQGIKPFQITKLNG